MDDTADFYRDDDRRTLFPLKTNRYLIDNGADLISDFISRCLQQKDESYSFRTQTRAYALKPGRHLRRTFKLDAVAEYFIYDLVYRNRSLFRKPHTRHSEHFGYRIVDGEMLQPSASYKGFKGAIAANKKKFKYSMSFDVASFFNSVYHHDLVQWFANCDASESDVNAFGQFLREINSGRSVDCLPQGIYPTKMIGNDFLRFIDNYHGLKSKSLIRFMDDIVIFSDNENDLVSDFLLIQRLLGDKGLSLNPNKTHHVLLDEASFEVGLDDIKKKLLQRRRFLVQVGYGDDEETIEYNLRKPLSKKEIEYVDGLLSNPSIEEDDAELVLAVMGRHAKSVEPRLGDILQRYPHLSKNVYSFCSNISDKESLAEVVSEVLNGDVHEYQLFWLGWILDDHLLATTRSPEIVEKLFQHKNATQISKAKVLEISDARYGLLELRDQHLGAGQSDWLAWSAAVGHRDLKAISRNHKLSYFGKSSNMNHLVYSIMTKAA